MDPNLFHLDWERTLEALVAIIVLAFFIERACALVFESRWYIWAFEDKRAADKKNDPSPAGADTERPTRAWPIKELVAFGVASIVCLRWDFDAVSMILLDDRTHLAGKLVTAAVIAGGSKASVKLFQDIMKIRSTASTERAAIRKEPGP